MIWTSSHFSKNMELLLVELGRLKAILCLDKLDQLFKSDINHSAVRVNPVTMLKVCFHKRTVPLNSAPLPLLQRLSKDVVPRTSNLTLHYAPGIFVGSEWHWSSTLRAGYTLEIIGSLPLQPHCLWTQVWLSGCLNRNLWYPASAVDVTDGQLLLFIYFYIHLFVKPTAWPLHLECRDMHARKYTHDDVRQTFLFCLLPWIII